MKRREFKLGGKTVWKIWKGRRVQVQLPPKDITWEGVKPIFNEIVKTELKRRKMREERLKKRIKKIPTWEEAKPFLEKFCRIDKKNETRIKEVWEEARPALVKMACSMKEKGII